MAVGQSASRTHANLQLGLLCSRACSAICAFRAVFQCLWQYLRGSRYAVCGRPGALLCSRQCSSIRVQQHCAFLVAYKASSVSGFYTGWRRCRYALPKGLSLSLLVVPANFLQCQACVGVRRVSAACSAVAQAATSAGMVCLSDLGSSWSLCSCGCCMCMLHLCQQACCWPSSAYQQRRRASNG